MKVFMENMIPLDMPHSQRVLSRATKAVANGQKRPISQAQREAMEKGRMMRKGVKVNQQIDAERMTLIGQWIQETTPSEAAVKAREVWGCPRQTARQYVRRWMRREGFELKRRIDEGESYTWLIKILEVRLNKAIKAEDDENIIKYTSTLLKVYGYSPGQDVFLKARPKTVKKAEAKTNIQDIVNTKENRTLEPEVTERVELPPPELPKLLNIQIGGDA